MSKTKFVLSIAVAALLVATPAVGQLANFPILALPAGDADGATSIGAGWGRGLSESSGKLDAIAVGVARAMETVSFGILGSYVIDAAGADGSSIALGGQVAYNVPLETSVDVGIQGGIEWRSDNGTVTAEDVTRLNFPLGISFAGRTQAGSLDIRPWIMPRVQFTRASSGGLSSTDTDFGTSAGVSGATEGGFGLGLSVDWAYVGEATGNNATSQWLFGLAVFYAL